MNVITLNDYDFDNACNNLADKIVDKTDVTALIGVRTGGAKVAKLVLKHLEKQGKTVGYYEAGASRYATKAKNSRNIKNVFNYAPTIILDWLRLAEHYAVSLRMRFSGQVGRSVFLDDELIAYLKKLKDGRLFLIDDAIDSGATLKSLRDKIHLINPNINLMVAVLVVTQKKATVSPDVCLYRNVLLRFPWSSDFKQ